MNMREKFTYFLFVSALVLLPLTQSYAKTCWLDLPPDSLIEILYEYNPKLDKLNELVQEYHSIPKTSWKSLQKRIIYLEKIEILSLNLKVQMQNEYLRRITQKYADLSKCKKCYLRSLLEIRNNYTEIKKSITNVEKVPLNYLPLELNNERKLEFKTQEFWGQYLIEAVDPSHRRQMISYYEIWNKENPHQTLPDFFLWLENKNVSLLFPSIELYDEKELDALQVNIKNGKFIDKNQTLITTKDISDTSNFKTEPIFIVDHKENMYLTYSSSQRAHVSLSHYKPIIGSGKIWINDGMITKISFESGHYLPKLAHYVQTFRYWETKGVTISDSVPLTYFEGYHEIESTVGDFKRKFIVQ